MIPRDGRGSLKQVPPCMLSFEGQFLLSLSGAMGDQSHNIMKLGYPPQLNALSHLLRRMAESCMMMEAETPILLGI